MYDEVVKAYEQNIKFIIGFAGSGKSTKLKAMANAKTLVLTPTHKAADVLKAKGLVNVYTIHSVLKLVPSINQDLREAKELKRLVKVGDTDLKDIDSVFIDEYSMINTSILDRLLAALPVHADVVIFGDAAQLPPVEGTPIDPRDYSDDIEELTVQHRAEAPEVVETFMRFMRFIRDGSELDLRLNKAIQHGTLESFNPETDRILAFTNKKVKQLNSLVKTGEAIEVGDAVLAGNLYGTRVEDSPRSFIYPIVVTKGRLNIDELPKKLTKAELTIAKYKVDLDYPTMTVELEEGTFNIYYDLDYRETSKRYEEAVVEAQTELIDKYELDKDVHIPTWCKEHYNLPEVRARAKAWSDYLNHTSYVFSVMRPYASTIHKAQGSEFDTVFLAVNDVKKAIRNGSYKLYARLMYVALSRAIKRVIIID